MGRTIPARTARERAFLALDTRAPGRRGLTGLDRTLIILIASAIAVAVIETEPTLARGHESSFLRINAAFGLVFLVEYCARLWVAAERDPARPARARLAFVLSAAGLVDLATIASTMIPVLGYDVALLRLARVVRILRLAELGALSSAMECLRVAVHSRRNELALAFSLALVALLVFSTLLFWCEGSVQPAKFGSIPRAMWWAVATLTTVGYGDVYPVTPLGKVVAAVSAMTGIAVVALPTGILAAAFSDAVQSHHARRLHK